MHDLDYFYLQLELEGIHVEPGNRIVPLVPNGDDFPLAVQVATADRRRLTFFDARLPCLLVDSLLESPEQPISLQAVLDLMTACERPVKIASFETYIFPAKLPAPDFKAVKRLGADGKPVRRPAAHHPAELTYAILRDGQVVSSCISVHSNAHCAEAWVITEPDYRRQGLAQQVVRAWAYSLRKVGMIPFYSHLVENLPSAALARRLGLIHVFTETVVEDLA